MALNKKTAALVGGVLGGASVYTLFCSAPATMAAITNPITGLLSGFLSASMANIAALIAVSVAAVLVSAVLAIGIQMLISKSATATSAPADEQQKDEANQPPTASL
jgi:hypothetical protein